MYIIKILNKLIFVKNLLIINNTQNFYNIDSNKFCYVKIFVIYSFTFYNKYLYKILCFNKNLRFLDTITKI